MSENRGIMKKSFRESLMSVLPITAIVVILCFTIAPIPIGMLTAFLFGAALLIIGMGFFTLGAETAMSPIGERIGAKMTNSRNLPLIILVSFVLGVLITVSEPDLQVLAAQVPSIPNMTLIIVVALGVGVFLVLAVLRIIFNINFQVILFICYGIVFLLAGLSSGEFVAVAFDSGGVTTGPMTVPFIMAFGVGIAAIRSDRGAGENAFGLVAISSIGPILAMLLLGMVYKPDSSAYEPVVLPEIADSRDLIRHFASELPHYAKEMLLALAPIAVFYLLYQTFSLKQKRRHVIKILIGLIYTYVGLVFFMTGVNAGFLPVGNLMGSLLAQTNYYWILVPVAMVIGYFIVAAEPAVHVLNKQVEEVTSGAIPQKAMSLSLSIGVSISLGLAMIRVITEISIFWFLVPGYAIALALTFFVPKIFTSIAFDSGGVASGAMATTFVLPFAMGACEALGHNVVASAFGVVAMVAMTPLITIQLLGLFYNFKTKKAKAAKKLEAAEALKTADTEIIDL